MTRYYGREQYKGLTVEAYEVWYWGRKNNKVVRDYVKIMEGDGAVFISPTKARRLLVMLSAVLDKIPRRHRSYSGQERADA